MIADEYPLPEISAEEKSKKKKYDQLIDKKKASSFIWYLSSDSLFEARQTVKNGIQLPNYPLGSLGDPATGVYMCETLKALSPNPYQTEGIAIKYRVIVSKGKYEVDNYDGEGNFTQAEYHEKKTKKSRHQKDIFEANLRYLFEYDENEFVIPPTMMKPIKIVKWKSGSVFEHVMMYPCWRGMLKINNDTLIPINVHSKKASFQPHFSTTTPIIDTKQSERELLAFDGDLIEAIVQKFQMEAFDKIKIRNHKSMKNSIYGCIDMEFAKPNTIPPPYNKWFISHFTVKSDCETFSDFVNESIKQSQIYRIVDPTGDAYFILLTQHFLADLMCLQINKSERSHMMHLIQVSKHRTNNEYKCSRYTQPPILRKAQEPPRRMNYLAAFNQWASEAEAAQKIFEIPKKEKSKSIASDAASSMDKQTDTQSSLQEKESFPQTSFSSQRKHSDNMLNLHSSSSGNIKQIVRTTSVDQRAMFNKSTISQQAQQKVADIDLQSIDNVSKLSTLPHMSIISSKSPTLSLNSAAKKKKPNLFKINKISKCGLPLYASGSHEENSEPYQPEDAHVARLQQLIPEPFQRKNTPTPPPPMVGHSLEEQFHDKSENVTNHDVIPMDIDDNTHESLPSDEMPVTRIPTESTSLNQLADKPILIDNSQQKCYGLIDTDLRKLPQNDVIKIPVENRAKTNEASQHPSMDESIMIVDKDIQENESPIMDDCIIIDVVRSKKSFALDNDKTHPSVEQFSENSCISAEKDKAIKDSLIVPHAPIKQHNVVQKPVTAELVEKAIRQETNNAHDKVSNAPVSLGCDTARSSIAQSNENSQFFFNSTVVIDESIIMTQLPNNKQHNDVVQQPVNAEPESDIVPSYKDTNELAISATNSFDSGRELPSISKSNDNSSLQSKNSTPFIMPRSLFKNRINVAKQTVSVDAEEQTSKKHTNNPSKSDLRTDLDESIMLIYEKCEGNDQQLNEENFVIDAGNSVKELDKSAQRLNGSDDLEMREDGEISEDSDDDVVEIEAPSKSNKNEEMFKRPETFSLFRSSNQPSSSKEAPSGSFGNLSSGYQSANRNVQRNIQHNPVKRLCNQSSLDTPGIEARQSSNNTITPIQTNNRLPTIPLFETKLATCPSAFGSMDSASFYNMWMASTSKTTSTITSQTRSSPPLTSTCASGFGMPVPSSKLAHVQAKTLSDNLLLERNDQIWRMDASTSRQLPNNLPTSTPMTSVPARNDMRPFQPNPQSVMGYVWQSSSAQFDLSSQLPSAMQIDRTSLRDQVIATPATSVSLLSRNVPIASTISSIIGLPHTVATQIDASMWSTSLPQQSTNVHSTSLPSSSLMQLSAQLESSIATSNHLTPGLFDSPMRYNVQQNPEQSSRSNSIKLLSNTLIIVDIYYFLFEAEESINKLFFYLNRARQGNRSNITLIVHQSSLNKIDAWIKNPNQMRRYADIKACLMIYKDNGLIKLAPKDECDTFEQRLPECVENMQRQCLFGKFFIFLTSLPDSPIAKCMSLKKVSIMTTEQLIQILQIEEPK